MIIRLTIFVFFCMTAALPLFAQNITFPDPNLLRAVRSALNLQHHQPVTRAALQHLERFKAEDQGIVSLIGLEHATGLESMDVGNNHIFDLSPLASLVNLRNLNLGKNRISDISPLAHLVNLRELHLTHNMVIDVSPLSNLANLRKLLLEYNFIEDVRPLANLTNLINLEIRRNPATDYSALLAVKIPYLSYDDYCEVAPFSVRDRLANRDYPSIGMPWGGDKGSMEALNRPDLTREEQIALHDMWFFGGAFDLYLKETSSGFQMVGDISQARDAYNEYLDFNPNLIFLKAVRMKELASHKLPEDSPFWLRDDNGNIVRAQSDAGLYDFTNPAAQERILAQVEAIDRCGFFDGIFIDHWNDGDLELKGHRTHEQEQHARETIINQIRLRTRPDFLVLGNAGPRILPMTGPLLNGSFMELVRPADKPQEDMPKQLVQFATTLSWLELHTREPHINLLEGWANPYEPPNSPSNLRWMRVFTTLSLTHSDGYVLFTNGNEHRHMWYDFWDADLGRPLGEKGQLYQDIDGLYIREFTNGWAAYNNSGAEQTITLAEPASGVASGLESTEHKLPDLDGEIYLRVKPPNPADVNGDGAVNILDLVLVAQAFGKDGLQGDVNGDGVVNVFDLVQVAGAIGGGGAAPSAYSLDSSIISAADVERWLTLAGGLGVGDANFQRGIRFLEGLLAALAPKETTLLPNYPNPFNPETWIPYRLARGTEVTITIYDTKGTPVRQLALGNQAAGHYAERGKAAYWDGRNEDGETVASGIYIYQFRAGDYAASRRMVVVK